MYVCEYTQSINQSIKIYIAPLQDTYSEALPTQAKRKNVGHGGSGVSLVPCIWRVAGSNPTLAATYGPWASPSLVVACSASAC